MDCVSHTMHLCTLLDGETTQSPPQKGGEPPIFGPFLLWPNGWMDQDATWHEGRPQPRRVCYMGTHPPPHKGGGAPSPIFGPFLVAKRLRTLYYMGTQSPFLQRKQSLGRGPQIFGPCLLGPNGWMDQDGTWHGGWPWSSPHCAGWGHSSPPKGGDRAPPIFGPSLLWPNGWVHQDMRLGMEVDFSAGDFVLDGDPAPTPKGAEPPPNFRHTSIVAKRLHVSRCYLVRRLALTYATLCSLWTQLPPEKGHNPPPPYLWPMSIVAKWLIG